MNKFFSKRALYVIASAPGDNAPTQHCFAIADLLMECGYAPSFMMSGIVRAGDGLLHKKFDYDIKIPATLIRSKYQLLSKYHERLTSCRAIRSFKKEIFENRPDIVIIYGISTELARVVRGLCAQMRIPVLVDETDWFDVRFSGFGDIAAYLIERSKNKRVEEVDSTLDGVIAISPFFFSYFENIKNQKGFPHVFFLPPLNRAGGDSDRACALRGRLNSKITKFIYAGSPNFGLHKDNLSSFFAALTSVSAFARTVPYFDVIGISDREAQIHYGRDVTSCENIRFHGRLSHEQVVSMLTQADFGVLIRQPARYSRAGFSTKFVECMSHGIPMLCNEVGGADSIINRGIDGLVAKDASIEELGSSILEACQLSDESLLNMKKSAFKKAIKLFYIDKYIDSFREFIDELVAIKARRK